jgi:hypothetical protein
MQTRRPQGCELEFEQHTDKARCYLQYPVHKIGVSPRVRRALRWCLHV